MLRFTRWMMILLLIATFAVAQDDAATPEEVVPEKVVPYNEQYVIICPIEGMVDDGMKVVVERAAREAEGAEALILQVDTPGGLVDAAIDISNILQEVECPTVAYVTGMGAISAGALISYSCDEIIMEEGTNIGASAPIVMGGGEMSEEVSEKTKSFLRARYRAIAEKNGHNALIGEAMVDSAIELRAYLDNDGRYVIYRYEDDASGSRASSAKGKGNPVESILDTMKESLGDEIGELVKDVIEEAQKEIAPEGYQEDLPPEEEKDSGTYAVSEEDGSAGPRVLENGDILVCAGGELLTLTTLEALRYELIPITAESVDDVMGYLDVRLVSKVMIVPTWSEALFRWLSSPMISSLLLLLGIGGIYIEIRTPGFGLPGIIGLCCLAVFFGSYLVIGLADWIDLLLILIGITLLLLEAFVIPGFGIAGISGIICVVVGLYLALTRVIIPQYTWDYDRLNNAGMILVQAGALFVIFTLVTWKLFPKTPFGRLLILSTSETHEEGYVSQNLETARLAVGLEGVATSVLRPAGRGRFSGSTYDIVTRGEFLEKGCPIVIIQAEGNRYVVAELKKENA